MRRHPGRALAGAVAALVAATVVPSAAWAVPSRAVPSGAPAEAASAGACEDPSGVTVVVDFAAFGGGVVVRCAGWPVTSGYDALRKAGFTITDTARYPGLLCRIDGLPGDQACVAAPPPGAYWGYWYAERGGSWTYSSQGAGSRAPSAGGVEGWAFGERARPSASPPAPPAPTTAPPPTAPPPTASPVPPEPSAPGGPVAATPGAAATTATTGPPVLLEGPSAAPGEEAAGDRRGEESIGGASASRSGPVRMTTSERAADDPGAGSPLPAVATGGVVVALGLGGAIARRRRTAG